MSMTAMYYMLHSILMQTKVSDFSGRTSMGMMLSFGVVIIGIFSAFVVLYTNNFLIKRRFKEFGLYSLLGMEKKHIARVILFEIMIVGAVSIIVGLLVGILFSKLMFMVFVKILGIKAAFEFGIFFESIAVTAVWFTAMFVLAVIVNTVRIYVMKPVELAGNGQKGEKEPKAKWLLAILGAVCLGGGYYIALAADNPIQAIGMFFYAVLLVMAGTYLLFMSGSVALLKCLKANKNYYYNKRHFITVSGMMYRMKRNAAGLANICILSTAVIVTLSSTISLYAGVEDVLRDRYPKEVLTEYIYEKENDEDWYLEEYHYDYELLLRSVEEYADKKGVTLTNIEKYYELSAVGTINGNVFDPSYSGIAAITMLEAITAEDYNTLFGADERPEKGEVLIGGDKNRQIGDSIVIAGKSYKVSKYVDNMHSMSDYSSVYSQVFVVVSDFDALHEMSADINAARKDKDNGICYVRYMLNFDLKGAAADKESFCVNLRDMLNGTGIAHVGTVENRITVKQEFLEMYGSLFFIGIFIGAMFVITTVMIIYYKQISEGYEDRERFEIMQKVGMSGAETKSVIKSQILLVFFLPILLAAVHICFAFDIIKDILALFDFRNVPLFILCTAATLLVFFAAYVVVYMLTARAYYKITYPRR